jgi:hypothetical protein
VVLVLAATADPEGVGIGTWLLPPLAFLVVGGGGLLWWVRTATRQLRAQGVDPRRPVPRLDPGHTFAPGRSAKLRGGARIGSRNATVPLVTLSVDEEWARLTGAFRLWIPREEVTGVELVTTVGGSGIRFATRSGSYDAVVFWTTKPTAVLDAFRRFRWPA